MSSFKFASNSLQHRFNAKLQRDRRKYFIYFQYKIYTSDRAFGMNISFAKHQELIFKTPRHVLVLHELIHENIAATGWFFGFPLLFVEYLRTFALKSKSTHRRVHNSNGSYSTDDFNWIHHRKVYDWTV